MSFQDILYHFVFLQCYTKGQALDLHKKDWQGWRTLQLFNFWGMNPGLMEKPSYFFHISLLYLMKWKGVLTWFFRLYNVLRHLPVSVGTILSNYKLSFSRCSKALSNIEKMNKALKLLVPTSELKGNLCS